MAVRIGKGNLLARVGSTAISMTAGTSDAILGLAGLYDGAPSWPWRAGAAAAAYTFKVNGDLLLGAGAFESLTGWTAADTGTGASALDATHHGGATSLKLTPGATGVAKRTKDITVRPGETIAISAWLQGSGSAAGPAKVGLLLVETGQYYDGAAWGASLAGALSRTANTFAQVSATATIPAFSTVLADTATLRVIPYNDGTAVSYVDDLVIYPSIDLATIHGHTLQPRHVVTVDSSDDGAAWTNRLTPTVVQPAFYGRITSPVAAQYWRVSVADALASGKPAIGELGLWLSVALGTAMRHPQLASFQEPEQWPQDRQASRSGAQFVTELAARQVRSRGMTFRHSSAAAAAEMLDELTRRSRGGADPIVLIPWDTEAAVLFGRVGMQHAPQRVATNVWDTVVEFAEEPGPSLGL